MAASAGSTTSSGTEQSLTAASAATRTLSEVFILPDGLTDLNDDEVEKILSLFNDEEDPLFVLDGDIDERLNGRPTDGFIPRSFNGRPCKVSDGGVSRQR